MKKTGLHGGILLILLFIGLYILPLGIRPLMRPDEFRYGEIAREMIASGDWLVPRLNGMRYFEKPVLGHWINAGMMTLFGENAFALRLGSALAVLMTAVIIRMLAEQEKQGPRLPVTAVLIYLTSGLVYGVGTFAVLDSFLAAFLTLTLAAFYAAWRSPRRRSTVQWLLLAGCGAGGAFLVKGFLALAVPAIVAAAFLLWQKEWKKLFLYPWLPFLVLLAVVLPWAVMIHRAEPDFWRYFVMEEHVNRFLSHTYDRKPQPFWYFIPVLLGGILPAGAVWIAGWRGASRNWLQTPFTRFLLCWAVLPFLFFSASSCKLGTYILPCFPPVALLTALALRRALRRNGGTVRRTLTILCRIWAGIWLAAALLLTGVLCIPRLHFLTAGKTAAGVLLVLTAVLYGLFLLRGCFRRSIVLTGGMVLLAPLVLTLLPAPLFGDRMTGIGIEACLKHVPVGPEDTVLTERSCMAAAAWTLRRSNLIAAGKPGELAYSLAAYPEYAGRHVRQEELAGFLAGHHGRAVYLTTTRSLRKNPLPPGFTHKAEVNGIVAARY